MNDYEEGKPLRRAHLEKKWLEHCRESGHVPFSEGGDAQHSANLAFTYIECRVEGCKWQYEREVGFSRLPSA